MSTQQTIDVETTAKSATALAVRPEQPLAVKEPQSYESLMALAKELCTTGFLPQAVKTPAQACAIILTGRELGLGPMQSLRSICIIQGKPELAADLQLSIFHRDGGRSKWLALTPDTAELWLRHPNGDEHTETFSMEDARRAGLAGGQNWQKYPKAMLRSRTITAGLKSIGFEPLAGAYAPGEIGGPEIVGPEPETVVSQSREKLTVDSGRAGGVSTSTPPRQSAGKAVQANAPKANSGSVTPAKTPKSAFPPATVQTRARLIRALADCEELATEYFRKLANPAVLLPTESLEDLPLEFVPISSGQMRLLQAAIADFGNGHEAVHAYPANPLAEEEKKKRVAKAKPAPAPEPAAPPAPPHLETVKRASPDWWRGIIVPIPPKGMKRDQYMQNPETIGQLYDDRHNPDTARRLFGFIGHFEVKKTWTDDKGQERQRSEQQVEADQVFREALDVCAEYHEKHGGDNEPPPRDEDDDVPF